VAYNASSVIRIPSLAVAMALAAAGSEPFSGALMPLPNNFIFTHPPHQHSSSFLYPCLSFPRPLTRSTECRSFLGARLAVASLFSSPCRNQNFSAPLPMPPGRYGSQPSTKSYP
ncbi:hypothetical protein B0H12DRAFT_1156269, partial [Mycena haematopus]